MSDASASSTPSEALRADTGNANQDRSDLADLPPAQVDGDAVQQNAAGDEEEPGSTADAART